MLEICVEDGAGIDAAVAGGAGRIELCAALAVGGLTPALSLIRAAAAAPLPVHLLARPRAGDFVYDAAERALVAEDIRTAAEAGLAGVVIGASRPDRTLDGDAMAGWMEQARAMGAARGSPLSVTLHRAIDLCPDMPAALDAAVALGVDRILTSGGAPRAIDGCTMLARLVQRAQGRIVVMAGSGIDAATLPAILRTGVGEVHASCRVTRAVPADQPERRFGFVGDETAAVDTGRVRALADALR